MTIATKLEYARSRTSLTLAKVEELTGIGQSSLSEFENGKREPRLSQLSLLANLYNRPISFFLDDKPIPNELVLWRMRPTVSADELENRFLLFCNQYRNLEEWCDEIISPKLPYIEEKAERINYNFARELAVRVRNELGLGDRPALQLKKSLEEDCGIKIFNLSFKPSGTAASTKDARFGMAILLNANNTRWRQNYDLAHELFHLMVWNIFRSDNSADNISHEQEEKLANCFASYLLMPDEPLKSAVERRTVNGKLSYESLFEIAGQFDVSAEALVWRLHFLYHYGSAKSDETHDLVEKIRGYANVYEQRQWNDTPSFSIPERYKHLAIKALRHGEISLGRFAEYLNISRKQASEYMKQGDFELEENQITLA